MAWNLHLVSVLLFLSSNFLTARLAADDLVEQLNAFPWPAYEREVGLRHDGLAVYLTLPRDAARFDALARIDRSRPLRLALSGKFTDTHLSRLRSLTNLKSLFLSRASITADGLKHLARLPIEEMALIQMDIEGDAIHQLAAMPQLRHLDVTGVAIDDDSFANFGKLARMKYLSVDREVDDRLIRYLNASVNLRQLTLGNAPISDEGLAQLRRLNKLESLMLIGTRITDDGLRHLHGMRHLVVLHVGQVEIGPTGLRHLAHLPHLQHLSAEIDEGEIRRLLPRVARQRLEGKLREDTALDATDAPLVDVLEYLSDQHELKIEIDDEAVEGKLVDPRGLVSLDVKGISLKSALRILTRSLGLTPRTLEDRILIASPRNVGPLETRTYHLDDLVAADHDAGVAEVVATIRNAIDPATWKPEGAMRSGIRARDLTIEVVQSRATHQAVQALLDELRGRPPRGAPLLRRIRDALTQDSTLTCKATPLKDVVDDLESFHGIRILLDPAAVKAGQLDAKTPVTIDAEDIPLAKLLSDMLGPVKLVWLVRDETLQITSGVQASKSLATRVYHIGSCIVDGRSAADVAQRIRESLEFEEHDDWHCSPCLNRIVVRAPLPTHRQVRKLVIGDW